MTLQSAHVHFCNNFEVTINLSDDLLLRHQRKESEHLCGVQKMERNVYTLVTQSYLWKFQMPNPMSHHQLAQLKIKLNTSQCRRQSPTRMSFLISWMPYFYFWDPWITFNSNSKRVCFPTIQINKVTGIHSNVLNFDQNSMDSLLRYIQSGGYMLIWKKK